MRARPGRAGRPESPVRTSARRANAGGRSRDPRAAASLSRAAAHGSARGPGGATSPRCRPRPRPHSGPASSRASPPTAPPPPPRGGGPGLRLRVPVALCPPQHASAPVRPQPLRRRPTLRRRTLRPAGGGRSPHLSHTEAGRRRRGFPSSQRPRPGLPTGQLARRARPRSLSLPVGWSVDAAGPSARRQAGWSRPCPGDELGRLQRGRLSLVCRCWSSDSKSSPYLDPPVFCSPAPTFQNSPPPPVGAQGSYLYWKLGGQA